ncbi:MAG: DEAD/DEAH box helicase family protein, partial [Clostridiaceae bacterium]
TIEDRTYSGKKIKVKFSGTLREEQQQAAEEILKYNNGVLSATTAFGKTVIGANIISVKKVNTLIIVHTKQLLEQWIKRLNEFLIIDEIATVENNKKRGRKKIINVIGQFGGGKNRLK